MGAAVVSIVVAAMVVLVGLGEADVVVVVAVLVKVVVLEVLVVVVIAAVVEATVSSATVLVPDAVTELLEVDRFRVSHPLHVLSHSSTNSPHKPLPRIR